MYLYYDKFLVLDNHILLFKWTVFHSYLFIMKFEIEEVTTRPLSRRLASFYLHFFESPSFYSFLVIKFSFVIKMVIYIICGVNSYVCGRFSTPSFPWLLELASPHTSPPTFEFEGIPLYSNCRSLTYTSIRQLFHRPIVWLRGNNNTFPPTSKTARQGA